MSRTAARRNEADAQDVAAALAQPTDPSNPSVKIRRKDEGTHPRRMSPNRPSPTQRSLRGLGGTDDLVLLNIESHSSICSSIQKAGDVDAFDHEELISMLADVVQGVDVD